MTRTIAADSADPTNTAIITTTGVITVDRQDLKEIKLEIARLASQLDAIKARRDALVALRDEIKAALTVA